MYLDGGLSFISGIWGLKWEEHLREEMGVTYLPESLFSPYLKEKMGKLQSEKQPF